MMKYFKIQNLPDKTKKLVESDPINYNYILTTQYTGAEIDKIFLAIQKESALVKISLEELKTSIESGMTVMLINNSNKSIEAMIRVYEYGKREGIQVYKRATIIKTGDLQEIKGISNIIYPDSNQLTSKDSCVFGIIRDAGSFRIPFIKEQNTIDPESCITLTYNQLLAKNPQLTKFLCTRSDEEDGNNIYIVFNQVMIEKLGLQDLLV